MKINISSNYENDGAAHVVLFYYIFYVNLFDLSDNVAIITGASRGIGQSIAEHFAQSVAKVVLTSRKLECIDTVAEKLKPMGIFNYA